MPRELILVGYKPNGPPALLVDTTEYAKVRTEYEKLRGSGRLPKGFTMARLFDSENGFVTIYDEPTRRLSVHQAGTESTKADLVRATEQLAAHEEQAKGLKAEIEAMEKKLADVDAKVNARPPRPITDDEQGIRVLLPDQINAAKNAHGTLLKKLEQARAHHKTAVERHEGSVKELTAFKESNK